MQCRIFAALLTPFVPEGYLVDFRPWPKTMIRIEETRTWTQKLLNSYFTAHFISPFEAAIERLAILEFFLQEISQSCDKKINE